MRIRLESDQPQNARRPHGAGGEIVCVVLILMGMATFAPAVLLSEGRTLEALDVARQREQHRLDDIQGEIQRQRRLLDAIHTDPGVISRLAKRELNLRSEDVVEVPVDARQVPEASPVDFKATPLQWPAFLRRYRHVLPQLNYDAVFCDDALRFPIICLSIGLVVVSLVVFRKRDPVSDS